jgi:CheY-like chemotaxis protein
VRSTPAILVVADDEEILTLMKIFFERSGMLTVDIATSATMAIGKLNFGKSDEILSDYEMPEMNGIELRHHVREQVGDIRLSCSPVMKRRIYSPRPVNVVRISA